MSISRTIWALSFAAIVAGCQGMPSEKPAVHINPNMDWQDRFNAQQANPFFDDNRADRLPVDGTVSRGNLQAEVSFYQGVTDNNIFVSKIPVSVTREMILRGKERYNIYCSMCHGGTGAGNGIITNYGIVPPPSFYDQRIVDMPDGEIYSAIYNGVRTMSSYRHQIPVEDRWAIVSYIRTLQRSRSVSGQELAQFGTSADQLQSAVSVDTDAVTE
jgi:mono/diheme cytochrome c family protein